MAKKPTPPDLTQIDQIMLSALETFAESVTASFAGLAHGEPEAQLTTPTQTLIDTIGHALGYSSFLTKRESQLANRLGRPDFAVLPDKLLVGYIELKEPGKGVSYTAFRGHDRKQWTRFKSLPNLIYTDGNQWAHFHEGERIGPIVTLSGDITTDGRDAITPEDVHRLKPLLTGFLGWTPHIPQKSNGEIDLKKLAELLAPLCRLLRDDVMEAMQDQNSPLVHLARDWRKLLFPEADDFHFADAYAQTVTFALLLARSESSQTTPLTLPEAQQILGTDHLLLARALQIFTDPQAQIEISASLNLLLRVIGAIPPAAMAASNDPWLYFYEDFLEKYDAKLRKDAGAYYTPVEVVRAQVRLVDHLLTHRLGKKHGFASSDVITLDPSVGTGTYLLGVIDHALKRVAEDGAGAIAGHATTLARNLYGFELMVGSLAVAELRISQALRAHGASLPPDGTHIYLTDTLENPNAEPEVLSFQLRPISDQHKKALKVKAAVPVIVCISNPPYDRHAAADATDAASRARTGGWVRWGDDEQGNTAILNSFIQPVKNAGHGGHLKNLYNLYVYFWRWAIWKVFESKTSQGPGIVSFITASSYIDGDAFCGMREHLRRQCDELWIIDLGGEGRGTRRDDNVFAIQTPVAIAIAYRKGKINKSTPATVRYTRIEGKHDAKLAALEAISDFDSLTWETCPDGWHDPFRPAGKGEYFSFPLLTDLMPWQQNGVKAGRTWVISSCLNILHKRWDLLCQSTLTDRAMLFKESPTGCKINDSKKPISPNDHRQKPIIELDSTSGYPKICRYAYRSFDRHFLIADARTLDRASPPLWATQSDRQIFLSSLFSHPLGSGVPITATAYIPDLDHFRGSYGAKAVLPLYRDALGEEPNILPGLLERLSEMYGSVVDAEAFASYVYGVLGHPAFTEGFAEELGTRELRVPITRAGELFEQVSEIGAHLLWLHTYGERLVPPGKHRGHIPRGKAKNTVAIPGDRAGYPEKYEYDAESRTLRVGAGAFAPVEPEVYEFEVSGLKVVQSWLGYRMKEPKGKRSSPLDEINVEVWPIDFTTELLELLWVLEASVAVYPKLGELLEQIVSGECIRADELPEVREEYRKPPKKDAAGLFSRP